MSTGTQKQEFYSTLYPQQGPPTSINLHQDNIPSPMSQSGRNSYIHSSNNGNAYSTDDFTVYNENIPLNQYSSQQQRKQNIPIGSNHNNPNPLNLHLNSNNKDNSNYETSSYSTYNVNNSSTPIDLDINRTTNFDPENQQNRHHHQQPPIAYTNNEPQSKFFQIYSRYAFLSILLSIIQVAVFIAELVKMGVYTGSPIQLKPSFNPMIGPSSYVLINMGARFTPCMHQIPGVTNETSILFPCPNSTSTTTDVCSLSELCGMGGLKFNSSNVLTPDQWWRFITPIFLHAGFIHIGFNLLLQLTMGSQYEKQIGLIRYFLIYFLSGISGFLLGGNFAPDGIASTGCSGSLFGIISLDLLDLLFKWKTFKNPLKNLIFIVLEIIISFVLGLLPGLDNFSHLGGFAMGILLGISLLNDPLFVKNSYLSSKTSSSKDNEDINGSIFLSASGYDIINERKSTFEKFKYLITFKFLKNRNLKIFIIWSIVRLICLILILIYFIALIKNFKNGGGNCSWCKYFNCLPVNGWCDIGNITTTTNTSIYLNWIILVFINVFRWFTLKYQNDENGIIKRKTQ